MSVEKYLLSFITAEFISAYLLSLPVVQLPLELMFGSRESVGVLSFMLIGSKLSWPFCFSLNFLCAVLPTSRITWTNSGLYVGYV